FPIRDSRSRTCGWSAADDGRDSYLRVRRERMGKQALRGARLLSHYAPGDSLRAVSHAGCADNFRQFLYERARTPPPMSAHGEALSPAQRGRHPWREIFHRVRDPRFVADSTLRAVMEGWDLVSPSEFSVLYRQIRSRTMCSNARLRGLYRALHYVVNRDIAGD